MVTDGPDAGKSFGLGADLVHIGTGADNQIVLSDAALAEHQASIASRNGRFAIYVPPDQVVQIEGNAIPTEKWVWLPAAATLRLGVSTTCRFESAAQGVNGAASPTASTTVLTTVSAETQAEEHTPIGGAGKKKAARKKKAAPRQVARFITEHPGETLVKLGDDGQLPELTLSDAQKSQVKSESPRERNPLLLYGALAFSFVMSVGLLLMDSPGPGTSANLDGAGESRQKIIAYFGEDGARFEPYQQELRQALIEAARGDDAAERRHYRRVLQMLNASDIRDPANPNGLTGRMTGRGRHSDDELREILQDLLAN